ncbi:MAG: Cell division protein FtsA [candidate division WS2 bacterium ADurb.Bin280]|uniref:Cell division protein FtsA n=1 Tax=candidate division WS2 bacterium ADurb.Bin280 TaxID=1852829 RepID=A0A1V5SFH1_9BACT|nr:MAG: Cell division protein FtsA [candidate division WS2 bacterium ADurb.Bin280]
MTQQDSIVGIDVGTTKVSVAVGQINEGMIQVLALHSVANSGMRKGYVVDVEEVVSNISLAIEEVERMCGFTLTNCLTSICSNQIVCVESKGVIATTRNDSEITEEDVIKAVEAAKTVALPPNYEIIHIVPKYFMVDGQNPIKEPVGLNGIRLEVSTCVVGTSTPPLRNLSKTLTMAGLEIEGIVFSPIASAKCAINKKQKEQGVVMIDFGASNTSIAVFIEGSLIHAKVFPIGSNHITNDIAIGLKISIEAAEKIKITEGSALKDSARESEKINLSKYEENEESTVSKKYVCEIIEARLNEIFSLIKEELKSIEVEGLLPAGAVISGGGAKLNDLQTFAKSSLSLPVQISRPSSELSGVIDKSDDPIYAGAIGLMLWGIDEMNSIVSNKGKAINLDFGKFGGALDKVKGIFKNLLP